MFCQLFGVEDKKPPPKAPPAKPKPPPKKSKKKAVAAPPPSLPDPKPQNAEQECAPFEHVEEASPEPADVATLEYDVLQEEEFEKEWDEDFEHSDVESNYEVSSISRHDDDEDQADDLYGSIQSSPGVFMKSSIKVEKKRPPGIAVTFDDDSWIE
jgi:hypothetical protein